MKSWKFLIPAAAVVIVAGALAWWYFSSALEVNGEVLTPSALSDSVTETGVVRQGNETAVLARVGGDVAEVLVSENDRVEAGDVLVRLDDRDLQYQRLQLVSAIDAYAAQIDDAINSEARDKADLAYSLAQLQAELDGLKLQNTTAATYEEYVQAVELELTVAQSDYGLAQSAYDSKLALYELDAISKTEMDAAAADLEQARAALENAQIRYDSMAGRAGGLELSTSELDSSIRATEANIQSLENKLNTDYSGDTVRYLTALMEGEQANLEYLDTQIEDCLIRAASSGIVTDLPAADVSYLSTGQTAAVLLSSDGLTVEVEVSADCAPYLSAGQSVTVTQKLKNNDIDYSGTILQVYDYATQSTSALGLEEYNVKVIVQAEEGADLLLGGEVEVEFPLFHEENVLSVPNGALFEVDDVSYVFVVRDGRAVRTEVSTGSRSNTRTVITDGLDEGAVVLTSANTEGLADGVRVKVVIK